MKTIEKLSQVDGEDKLLDPRELSYRLKNSMRRKLDNIINKQQEMDNDELKNELRELLDREGSKELFDYDTLSEIHKRLQRLDSSYDLFFYQFLDEFKAVVPKRKENRELEQRLQKLKHDASSRTYGDMTSSINTNKHSLVSEVQSMKSDMQQLKPVLITVLNSVLVVGGTFLFVFKAVEYASSEPNISVQILSSILASSIVALAELYFLMKIM
jgi:hypothetical protein